MELSPRSLRRLRRRSERGAAIFVVVLVIVMLTSVGLFAVRSSILSTTSSGHERQMTQTHYLTEYAVVATTAELSTERREAYVRVMARSPDCPSVGACKCKGIGPGASTALPGGVTNRTCYLFGYEDLQQQLGLQTSGALFITPMDTTNKKPGSLGHGNLGATFLIEMTDLGPVSPPVAGSDLSSTSTAQVQFMAVTLNALGQVHPLAASGSDKAAAGVESGRAHLIVGPLPKL